MLRKLIFIRPVLLLALVFCVAMPGPIQIRAAEDVIVHFRRDDGAYDDWNIWFWPEGGEGSAYYWTDDDAFGKVAVIPSPGNAAIAGFIVRTDAWAKDFDADRFIDLTRGNEIWVYSGQEEFFYEAPEGFSEPAEPLPNLSLTVYYNRYDGNDGGYGSLEASLVMPDGTSVSVFSDYPEGFVWEGFGTEYTFNVGNGYTTDDKLKLNFITGGETDEYTVSLRNAAVSEDGASSSLEMYCVMGSGSATYVKPGEDAPPAPNVSLDNTLDAPDLININTNYPVKAEEGVENLKLVDFETREEISLKEVKPLNEGGNDEVFGKLKEGYASEFQMTTEESIAFDRSYEIVYGSTGASAGLHFGDVYSSPGFEEAFTYNGELGALYSKDKTKFVLWSPAAKQVELILDGDMVYAMERGEKGTWVSEIEGDLKGTPYNFIVDGREAADPYAKAVGVNGTIGVVTDLKETNPENWESDSLPELESPVDAVIYEIHVRDFSSHESSGMTNKGKFTAFTEKGTKTPDGRATGVDHLKELGVNYVHLLPSFDYASLDESAANPGFNWGYDPLNYNAPEGTYSTDASNPNTRISEFKQMVRALHGEGIGVIMDVVYNHTATAENNNLNVTAPGYYYRLTEDGAYSNGSGCGNEIASERSMVRKMIADSVVYWAKEYHVDGFRFDLMGLHDIETMNLIRAELDKIDPQIIMYGEGWTAGTTTLPAEQSALKANMNLLDERIAAFSDDIRDGIKGSVFDAADPGFVNGMYARKEQIKFGIAASVSHPQVDTTLLANSTGFWATSPTQTVTYDSAHDNLTLWDKLTAASPNASEDELLAMNRMAAAIVLTSQGIPFLHAGEELARTKDGDHNSYMSPDSVNQIRWDTKTSRIELFDYYKGLIALRKSEPLFRLRTAEAVREKLNFLDTEASVLAYTLDGSILVAFNANSKERELTLPKAGVWSVLADGNRAGTEAIETVTGDALTLTGRSAFVLRYEGEAPAGANTREANADASSKPAEEPEEREKPVNIPLIALLAISPLILGGGAYLLLRSAVKKSK